MAAIAAAGACAVLGCSRDEPTDTRDAGAKQRTPSAGSAAPSAQPPMLLLLDGGLRAPTEAPALPEPFGGVVGGRCPPEMVDVQGRFCIDRFEASLVDAAQGRALSPHYHPTRAQTKVQYEQWGRRWVRSKTARGRGTPIPEPPEWQLREAFDVRAVSRKGVLPNGYLSQPVAARACRNAGKRLCRPDEWLLACRGEQQRQFPYGTGYVDGRCNVFRPAHPAKELHGNASIHHLDPRLHLVESEGEPLLLPSGAAAHCASQWGSDAAYDMVGNLDEWVDDPGGLFLGGFFSRSTKEGCHASVSSHPPEYFDYSLGVRCCR